MALVTLVRQTLLQYIHIYIKYVYVSLFGCLWVLPPDKEKQRANRVQEDLTREKDEAERQRSRAEVAERERDSQADASRQHEE